MDTAELLRQARARSDLTQAEVARRSGTDPSVLSAYERGRRLPSIATLDRLLAVCGLQLHAELEPLHADLDRQIDQLAALDPHARLLRAARWGQDVPEALAALVGSDTPFAVTGPAAALLLGVPVPVARIDLTVQAGVEAARRVVAGFKACRGAHLQLLSRDEYAGAPAMYVAPEVIAQEGVTLWERPAGDRYNPGAGGARPPPRGAACGGGGDRGPGPRPRCLDR